jgi:hypothetical protein
MMSMDLVTIANRCLWMGCLYGVENECRRGEMLGIQKTAYPFED